MASDFSPHTYRIVVDGIAANYMIYPHFCAFIETGSNSPTVMMTANHASEPDKIDFQQAMGGNRKDDGRNGIFVYMRWSGTPRMGDAVTVTVWQDGAEKYGAPEPLPEDKFDQDNPTAMFEQGPVDF